MHVDPIEQRRKENVAVPTFGQMADTVAADLSHGFRNDKHKSQWTMTLTVYAKAIRDKPVNAIDTEHVLGVLKPIWETKRETASRLPNRLEHA